MSAEVIHGDCMDVLRGMPDASVDAVLTDPPYNVGLGYVGYSDARLDYRQWCGEWFAELLRISRGPIAISCGIPNIGMWCTIQDPTWILAWWKPAAMGRCHVGFNNWEPVLFYGKTGGNLGADVIRAPIMVREDTGDHPCPKPVAWAAGLLERLVPGDALVLDPFTGSGTTGVACVQTGRRFVGIEREAAYVSIARARIVAAGYQGRLLLDGAA